MQRRLHSMISQNNALFKKVLPSYRIYNRSVVLSYKILGDATETEEPPIFLFHSLLSGKRHWEGIGKILLNVTKRSVVVVDLRNHGDSPHTSTHRYLDHAEDIMNLFKKLGVEQATVIGHGMGGKAVMCLALMEPLKITGVLVLDISPISPTVNYRDEYPKILTAMKAVDFKNPKIVPPARAEAEKQLKSLIVDDYLLSCIISNIRLKKDNTIGWNINIDVLLNDIKYIADFPKLSLKGKKYYGPTLLIGGQLSDLLPPDDLTEIRAMFPRAVITYIPKTRHNVHIDDPRAFLEIAISFIRTHHFKRHFKPPALTK